MTKTCCTCKQEKPVDQFNKNRASKDGLQGRCRECSRATWRKHYADNKYRMNEEKRIRENYRKWVGK